MKMEEKKIYETPDAEFVELDGDDVVASSCGNFEYGDGCTGELAP